MGTVDLKTRIKLAKKMAAVGKEGFSLTSGYGGETAFGSPEGPPGGPLDRFFQIAAAEALKEEEGELEEKGRLALEQVFNRVNNLLPGVNWERISSPYKTIVLFVPLRELASYSEEAESTNLERGIVVSGNVIYVNGPGFLENHADFTDEALFEISLRGGWKREQIPRGLGPGSLEFVSSCLGSVQERMLPGNKLVFEAAFFSEAIGMEKFAAAYFNGDLEPLEEMDLLYGPGSFRKLKNCLSFEEVFREISRLLAGRENGVEAIIEEGKKAGYDLGLFFSSPFFGKQK